MTDLAPRRIWALVVRHGKLSKAKFLLFLVSTAIVAIDGTGGVFVNR